MLLLQSRKHFGGYRLGILFGDFVLSQLLLDARKLVFEFVERLFGLLLCALRVFVQPRLVLCGIVRTDVSAGMSGALHLEFVQLLLQFGERLTALRLLYRWIALRLQNRKMLLRRIEGAHIGLIRSGVGEVQRLLLLHIVLERRMEDTLCLV